MFLCHVTIGRYSQKHDFGSNSVFVTFIYFVTPVNPNLLWVSAFLIFKWDNIYLMEFLWRCLIQHLMHNRSSIKCQLLFYIQMLVLTQGPCADRIRGRERVEALISLSSFKTKEVRWGISGGILLETVVMECWCWWLNWAQSCWDVGKAIINSSFLHHFLFSSWKNETSNLDLVGSHHREERFRWGKIPPLFWFPSSFLRDLWWMVRTREPYDPLCVRPMVPVGRCSSN